MWFPKQQSFQKTRMQEFNVEGNKHCARVNSFLQGTIMYPKPGDVLKLWNTREKNPDPQSQVDYFPRRTRGGLTVGSKVCHVPWGQQCEIACYTTGQYTQQFAVLPSFTLLIVQDENGFVHTTMAKAAQSFLQQIPS